MKLVLSEKTFSLIPESHADLAWLDRAGYFVPHESDCNIQNGNLSYEVWRRQFSYDGNLPKELPMELAYEFKV